MPQRVFNPFTPLGVKKWVDGSIVKQKDQKDPIVWHGSSTTTRHVGQYLASYAHKTGKKGRGNVVPINYNLLTNSKHPELARPDPGARESIVNASPDKQWGMPLQQYFEGFQATMFGKVLTPYQDMMRYHTTAAGSQAKSEGDAELLRKLALSEGHPERQLRAIQKLLKTFGVHARRGGGIMVPRYSDVSDLLYADKGRKSKHAITKPQFQQLLHDAAGINMTSKAMHDLNLEDMYGVFTKWANKEGFYDDQEVYDSVVGLRQDAYKADTSQEQRANKKQNQDHHASREASAEQGVDARATAQEEADEPPAMPMPIAIPGLEDEQGVPSALPAAELPPPKKPKPPKPPKAKTPTVPYSPIDVPVDAQPHHTHYLADIKVVRTAGTGELPPIMNLLGEKLLPKFRTPLRKQATIEHQMLLLNREVAIAGEATGKDSALGNKLRAAGVYYLSKRAGYQDDQPYPGSEWGKGMYENYRQIWDSKGLPPKSFQADLLYYAAYDEIQKLGNRRTIIEKLDYNSEVLKRLGIKKSPDQQYDVNQTQEDIAARISDLYKRAGLGQASPEGDLVHAEMVRKKPDFMKAIDIIQTATTQHQQQAKQATATTKSKKKKLDTHIEAQLVQMQNLLNRVGPYVDGGDPELEEHHYRIEQYMKQLTALKDGNYAPGGTNTSQNYRGF